MLSNFSKDRRIYVYFIDVFFTACQKHFLESEQSSHQNSIGSRLLNSNEIHAWTEILLQNQYR